MSHGKGARLGGPEGSRDLRPIALALMAALVLLASAISYFAPRAAAQEAPPATSADLWLVVQEPSDPQLVGKPLTYNFKIGNSGPQLSTGSSVVAQIDPIASFVSASPGCSLSVSTLYCELGALEVGAEHNVALTLTPNSEGTLFLPAGVDGSLVDQNTSNNTWVEDTTIAPPAAPVTLTPVADTFVRRSAPNTNFGAAKTLEADSDPLKVVMMKFDKSAIQGRQIASAKLRLYSVDPSSRGGSIYGSNGAQWSEMTTTYASRPRWGDVPVGSLGVVTINKWYEVDVTAALGSGNEVTFFVVPTSADGADYSSREGTNPPQLVISFAGPAPQVTN